MSGLQRRRYRQLSEPRSVFTGDVGSLADPEQRAAAECVCKVTSMPSAFEVVVGSQTQVSSEYDR